MAVAETSRTYTISLPAETAKRAEALAADEKRSMSELLAVALRTYESEQERLKNVRELVSRFSEEAMRRNPGLTEADVPRLIKESRVEREAESRR